MTHFLSEDQARLLVRQLADTALPYTYDYEKHRILINNNGLSAEGKQDGLIFRLPLTLPSPEKIIAGEVEEVHYVILLIQAGSCALGYFEGNENLDHKVIRAYMVRKKQGKSQIKYLKTKGKSRAGSRVRLGETTEFFENINERLQDYFEEHTIDRIAISCSKTLIPYLFSSKPAPPFTKKEERLYKIPRHVHTPKYEVLLDTHKFLCSGELIYEEDQQEFVSALLNGKR